MEKEELAKQYRIQQYIDFGDLNEKAEQQIEQAFIDGYEKALNLFGVSISFILEKFQEEIEGAEIDEIKSRLKDLINEH